MPQMSPMSWVKLSFTMMIIMSVMSLLNVTNPTKTGKKDMMLNKKTLKWSW